MDDIGIRLTTNDEGFTSAIEKAIASVNKLDEAEEQLNKTISASMNNAVDSTDKYNSELSNTTSKLKDSAKEQKQLTEEVKNSIRNYKFFGVSINDVSGFFKKAAASSKLMAGGINAGNQALRVMKIAIAATGIGALIIAAAALFANFTRTQKGADKLSRAMAGVGAAVDVVIDLFSGLGEGMIKAFEDPKQAIKDLFELIKENIVNRITALPDLFIGVGKAISRALTFDSEGAKEAVGDVTTAFLQFNTGLDAEQQKEFAEGIKKVTQEMKEEAIAAAKLEGRKQALRDSERDLGIETAKTRAEIKELNKIAEDTTKSTEERQKAASKAIGIEQGLLAKRIKNAQEEVNILKEKNALGESLTGDLDAQADAEVKLANLRTESAELQTTLNNKLNTIVAEGLRKVETLNKAYSDLFQSLKDQLFESELENSSPIEQLNKQFLKDIEELEKAKSQLLKLAEDTGGDTEAIHKLFEDLKAELLEGLNNSLEDLDEDLDDVEVDLPDVEITGDKIKSKDPISKFKEGLIKAMGLSPEEAKVLEKSFKDTMKTLVGIYTDEIDAKIEANQSLRQELEDNITNIESQLEEEKKLKDQGLANDVDRLTLQLEEENALKTAAQKEAEELNKKKARVELLQNVASQISNLTTAATSIFKSTGSIPFGLGVPLAIGFIASMYAAFKSFKAQANADIKLYTGAERVGDYFGQPAPGGASDIPGKGNGYRIEGTNVRIGGNEFLSTERAAADHYDFLNDLNQNPNNYKGVDIADSVRMARSLSAIGKSSRKLNVTESRKASRAIEAAIYQGASMTVEAINNRPHYLVEDGKQVKITKGRKEKKPL